MFNSKWKVSQIVIICTVDMNVPYVLAGEKTGFSKFRCRQSWKTAFFGSQKINFFLERKPEAVRKTTPELLSGV